MKKMLLTGLALAMTAFNANAKTQICPFTDFFAISAPPGYTISSIISDGNIISTSQGPRNFTISCKDYASTRSGKVYLTVGIDQDNLCTIHITDGPYEMNPYVNFVNCTGDLQYSGIEHERGYSYTLKFTH